MGETIRVMANDPAYTAMVRAAAEALRHENLRIVVRGQHNRKDGLLPVERFELNFYVAGSMGDATAFKSSYTAADLQVAITNTERLAVIGSMFEVLDGGGVPVDQWEPDGEPMTVLTTRGAVNGAGVIFCDNVLRKIWEKVGDFYVLPSSVHEVLIVPVAYGIGRDELTEMVRAVNRDEVAPEDQLSDQVYLFDGTLH